MRPGRRFLSISGALAAALTFAPPARAQNDLGGRLDEHLQRLVPWGFSGSILVARSGRVVLASGYGLADRGRAVANASQTLYPLGALSQQFTAAAVLLLADQGRIALDDALGARLDGVPADKQALTLRQLLHHTAGFPAGTAAPLGPAESKEEALARILGTPLAYAPGARCEPSASGYALLCAVVEKHGGAAYEEFVRKELFDRAGMAGAAFVGEARAKTAQVARGYSGAGEESSPATWEASWPFKGFGSAVASVGDLYRWERALAPDVLLSAAAVEELHEPAPGSCACGLTTLRNDAGRRVAQQSSSFAGFQCELRRGLDDALAWALLLNEPMPAAVLHVEALLSGKVLSPPPEVELLEARAGAAVAGGYELPGGGRLRVTFERGELSIAAENQAGVDALALPNAGEKAWEAEFGSRALALCENLRGRDFPAAAALLGRTAQEVDGQLGTWWRRLEERHGAPAAVRPLAALPRAQAVVLRLEFERGSEVIWFRWNGRALSDFQPGPATFHSGRLWPAKGGGLVTYDPATFTERRLALMLRTDGSVRGLSFPADGGEASELGARRLD